LKDFKTSIIMESMSLSALPVKMNAPNPGLLQALPSRDKIGLRITPQRFQLMFFPLDFVLSNEKPTQLSKPVEGNSTNFSPTSFGFDHRVQNRQQVSGS
jgi:hypothetical protein